jgi:hypothetical protein
MTTSPISRRLSTSFTQTHRRSEDDKESATTFELHPHPHVEASRRREDRGPHSQRQPKRLGSKPPSTKVREADLEIRDRRSLLIDANGVELDSGGHARNREEKHARARHHSDGRTSRGGSLGNSPYNGDNRIASDRRLTFLRPVTIRATKKFTPKTAGELAMIGKLQRAHTTQNGNIVSYRKRPPQGTWRAKRRNDVASRRRTRQQEQAQARSLRTAQTRRSQHDLPRDTVARILSASIFSNTAR